MGGTAVMGALEPQPGLALGNPIHLATGNKYQLEVDLPPNPSAPGLALLRHYNGLATSSGAFGRNWSHSYELRLLRRHDGWRVRQGDGSLRKVPSPVANGSGWSLSWPGGHEFHFDAQGHLAEIRKHQAAPVVIHRHPASHPLAGHIHRVQAGEHRLDFHYEEHHGQQVVSAIDTPLGRFQYHYDQPPPASGHSAPRLVAVHRPDGMRRLYHHEPALQSGNAYALTGISVALPGGPPQRLSTWEYDRYGRVIAMRQHGRALPTLRVEYAATAGHTSPGLTRIHASNGTRQDIHYQRIAGQYRLLHRSGLHQSESFSAYDQQGRLTDIDGLRLLRGPGGELAGLTPAEPGWPGLTLSRHPHSGRYTWSSHATGATSLSADAAGRPAELEFANGDTLRISRDPQGRPTRLEYALGPSHNPADNVGRVSTTHLQWRGPWWVHLRHPNEAQRLRRNDRGLVLQRSIQRPPLAGAPAVVFRERFEYGPSGRLQRHHLPEGGVLHYEWHHTGRTAGAASTGVASGDAASTGAVRLAALHWENARGELRPVVTSNSDIPGYRHGNGLELVSLSRLGTHADTLLLMHDHEQRWIQHREYDDMGRVSRDRHDFPPHAHHDEHRYAYDRRSRLIGAVHEAPGKRDHWWYAWNADGSLAALTINGHGRLPGIQRDASGLAVASGNHRLLYEPGRRLASVSAADTGQPIAHYLHNALGQRIVKQRAQVTTHFLYLDGRLAAAAHSADPNVPPVITRRYIYAGLTPVGMIEYPVGEPPRLYAVHADLSGTPRMVTDADRRMRWLAGYTPTGQARRVDGDLDFALRLPGQYEDEETGRHDNLFRTYDPAFGHYLEPDPLGPLPGTDAYGYARQQPWRHADPYGLLLFAFDGTRYSADTMGNVWKLAQAYRDGAAHYHSGPGNSYFLDWDAVVAWRAGRILENQWQALLSTIEHHPRNTVLPIDIVGFSRGAALARHFGNRIASHVIDGRFSVDDPLRGTISACVDLRFMGLFDTVAQFGISGSHDHLYDFGVSELWSWVSHAVALHEHRWAFPLTSADAGGAGNVVEAPFVGAHADIGGGLAVYSPPSPGQDGDVTRSDTAGEHTASLADVALAWMHWQAVAANVDFHDLPSAGESNGTAWLTDLRSPLARSLQRGDRSVLAPSGALRLPYQDDDPRLGGGMRAQVESFITRLDGWRAQAGDKVGTVDMTGYARWLEDTLGWSPQDGQ